MPGQLKCPVGKPGPETGGIVSYLPGAERSQGCGKRLINFVPGFHSLQTNAGWAYFSPGRGKPVKTGWQSLSGRAYQP